MDPYPIHDDDTTLRMPGLKHSVIVVLKTFVYHTTFNFKIAAQEAQRAVFYVEKAIQEKQEKIVQATGEAEAAKLVIFFVK